MYVHSSKNRFINVGPADRYTLYITANEALIAQPTNQFSLYQRSSLLINYPKGFSKDSSHLRERSSMFSSIIAISNERHASADEILTSAILEVQGSPPFNSFKISSRDLPLVSGIKM